MPTSAIKDLMIPLREYATVHQDATLLQAMLALEESQDKKQGDVQPYRAVLVVDDRGDIVGKLGHRGFLQALEPKYGMVEDLDKLNRAGVSSEFISYMAESMRLWEEDLTDLGKLARSIKVRDVMHSVEENVDENISLMQAIHHLVMWGNAFNAGNQRWQGGRHPASFGPL